MTAKTIEKIKENIQASNNGVWAMSSDNHYVIFASDLDFEETIALLDCAGVGYKNLTGSYVMESTGERIEEDSFIVNANQFDIVHSLDLVDNQESILYLGNANHRGHRAASLVFQGEEREPIDLGFMQPVDDTQVLFEDNWTYDPYLKQFFICSHVELTSNQW